MSLRPSDFDQFVLASDRIDYISLRLTEAKVLSLSFLTDTQAAVDITSWTFATSYFDATATFTETATGLTSVTNITLLTTTAQTDTNLAVTKVSATGGTAALTIPTTVTSMPSADVPIDAANTLLKLIKITATYASTEVPTFNIVDQYQIGVIIRFGG